jgi:DNA replicative helicase MCM subunit Mcm2 (Cdc46/Mcm family)
MLTTKIKKNFKEHKGLYVAVGTGIFVGFVLGAKVQRKVDVKQINRLLKDAVLFEKAVKPMFPATMGIPEIKEALLKIEGAVFNDALVTTVNGAQSLIIR